MISSGRWALALAATLAVGSQAARGDDLVQAPQLAAPQRASLAGEYGHVAFGPADVERGGFALALPLKAPEARGPLLAAVFPSYSPDAGLSEWGMGWSTALAVTRTRVRRSSAQITSTAPLILISGEC